MVWLDEVPRGSSVFQKDSDAFWCLGAGITHLGKVWSHVRICLCEVGVASAMTGCSKDCRLCIRGSANVSSHLQCLWTHMWGATGVGCPHVRSLLRWCESARARSRHLRSRWCGCFVADATCGLLGDDRRCETLTTETGATILSANADSLADIFSKG